MTENQENVCQNTELLANLEKMLNNETYSDTVFFVNKMKFYASSHLVSVSSIELESMLKIHYENCKDREIKLGDIAFEESFLVILRFMYGLEINLSQMEKAVLCEVLCLAERFRLDNFFTQLKNYLSKLGHFELDFVVVLLNTARKYKIEELYGKLTVWASQNADCLVNHESFASLQYDVLLDLVKADSFCTQEVDILKGVLHWHFSTMMKPSTMDETENAMNESSMELERLDGYPSNQSLSELNSTLDTNEATVNLMKEFSTNVLKSLLSHIRCAKISLLDMSKLQAEENELYANYKVFLDNYKHFSSNTEPRKIATTVNIPSFSTETTPENIVPEVPTQLARSSDSSAANIVEGPPSSSTGPISNNVVALRSVRKYKPNVSKKFTVKYTSYNQFCESKEEFIRGNMKWKIYGRCLAAYHVYLKCTSMHNGEWECKVDCQIKVRCLRCKSPILFSSNTDGKLSFEVSSNRPLVRLGCLYKDCSSHKTREFTVKFISIQTKVHGK